ncbi:ABC transporter permease [Clostridium isatidis]|uniref:Uncharacterized protein n=2 Tax=Clostridium isatidis TaxID=182773 RepID=A0A343JA35_9CLOT|nr:ABC transporter permease [Clostridium isatidis]ASW42393.1 hypothetical protein BEN51_02495 [Clostridium isatidis]
MNIFRCLYRYIRKTNFIFLCIVSMLLFFSLIVGNVENITKIILEANNQLTSNYISIRFNDKLENQEVLELINKVKQSEDIIIKYYLQTGFDYDVKSEGIFFNGTFNNSYNLLEGRFFTKDDFRADANFAVIGKEVLRYTKVENGRRYILRGLDKYEVIGVVGKEKLSSRYDDIILYNLNSILNNKEILNKDTWWIDSLNKSKIEIKEEVTNIGDNQFIEIIDEVDNSPNPLAQAIKRSQTLIISFVLIILCVLLTLVRSIIYWIESISLEIGVRKKYGATNKEIFFDIVKRYILISTGAMIISIIIQKVFLKINFLELVNYQISYINIILSIMFIITLGIIFICIAMYKISKIGINQLLKGR